MIKTIPLFFCLAGAVSAQSFEAEWLNDLSIQLLVQNDCAVDYFVAANEVEGKGGLILKARAKCRDGRYFDANRDEGEWGFKLEKCGAETC